MKKVTMALALAAFFTVAKAQDGNNICVFNAMSNFGNGGGADDLERGIKCSDEAATNESTIGKWKTWYYRGQLYTLVAGDTALKKKYLNAPIEAVKSFQKLVEINDPKFKDWDEAYKYIYPLSTTLFNAGVTQYQAKNYAQAAQYFYTVKDLNGILTAKGKKNTPDLASSIKNAAISQDNAGDAAKAFTIAEELYKLEPDTLATIKYVAGMALKVNNKDRYMALVDEGLKKYPSDPDLLRDKINQFIEKQDYTSALTFVNNLLKADPLNSGAWTAKGLAYQNFYKDVTGKMDSLKNTPDDQKKGAELKAKADMFGDSLLAAYNQAATLNAKNLTAWTNLGVYYVDKANVVTQKMNKLGNGAEDLKKYDALKKEQKGYYLQAKPYLQKANELDPKDTQVSRILKQIDLYTNEQ